MKLPGFIDSHLHVLGLGYVSYNVDLTEIKSIEELKEKLDKFKDRGIIIGRGWNQENFTEKRMITKCDLNEISKDIPIVMTRVCGHVLTVNEKMLELAGIDKFTQQVSGGSFSYETGIFTEHALGLIYDKMPLPTEADLVKYLLTADKILIENGITSVASDDFAIFPLPYEQIINTIKKLYEQNLLHIKITEQVNLGYKRLKDFISKGYVNKSFGKYRMGPLKILVDGSLGGKTAKLSQPYEGEPSNTGIATYTDDELFDLVYLADSNGMDVVIHAIGDAASLQAIKALMNSLEITKRKDHHHAIIHAQLTNLEQIAMMKEWNIGAIVQPIFLNSDIQIIESRIGSRQKESYLFKTMYDIGLTVGFSTDAPIEPVNPFLNIYSAMTRTSIKNPDLGVFLEKEKFEYDEALECYYKNNLRFIYQDLLSSDDYIIVDRPFSGSESLLKMKVVKTVIDGETVFDAMKE